MLVNVWWHLLDNNFVKCKDLFPNTCKVEGKEELVLMHAVANETTVTYCFNLMRSWTFSAQGISLGLSYLKENLTLESIAHFNLHELYNFLR